MKTHAVVWGICNRRSFVLLIVGGAIKAEISEPQQQTNLPQGGLEVRTVRVDSWAPSISLTFSFSQDRFNIRCSIFVL